MLSFVAVLDILFSVFCIIVTEESFCWSWNVGFNCSNRLRSSIEDSEVGIVLWAGDVYAAIKIEMVRKQDSTHKAWGIDNETRENVGPNGNIKVTEFPIEDRTIPHLHLQQ